ncbi:uncharacterized protein [Littorina saxatilis]|uniref:uncharacterized protein n=1 Tax=Littorina saxatilis TaxID=31220 RepID=UPI0038B4594F
MVITLLNLACADRNKAEIMKHKQLLDSLFSISIDQSHSHRLNCIGSAKKALSKLGMNPQDMQDDGTRRTGLLDMSSETEDSGRQIPMSAPQRMDSTNNDLTSSLPNGSPNLSISVELEHMPHSGSTYSIQPGNMTGNLTPRSLPQLMSPDFMPHGAMSNSSQTNHAPPLVNPFHRPPFRMRYSVPSSGPINSLNGMHYGSLSNNVQLSDVPPFTTPGHLPPAARMPLNVLPDGGMNGIPYGSMANTARPCTVPPAGAHGNLPPAMMNRTVPHSGLTNSVPPGGIQTNIQPSYVPHLPPSSMPSDCPARNTTDNPPAAGSMSIDWQTASFSNSMNGILNMQNYIQPGNVHSGNTPSSGTHCIMHNNHGDLPYFGMTGGAPVLGMMGHEPNTTMLPDPRNAPKSISGNIRPEEETLNVGSSQVGSCTQIDPNSSSTVPMDSDMDNEQLSTIDSSSIRPIPSLPVISRTESLSRSSVITTAPFSGNTAVSTSRSATAKSSSTDTVQQGSLSPGPSSTAGNSSSHAPPAISMSTTGGGLPSSSTFAKPSTPIVPGSGPDFSVLSPCETLNSYNPPLPLYHESNLYTPCPPSVSSESASTPRSPDQQHSITSPESRGSFTSQPSPGHGVTTSEHAQEGFSAPPSPPHSGLPPAMNQEGSSLYRPGEQNNNFMKTHAGEARTCRIIFKADGKPAALPSNPESESSSKAQNRAQRTVSSSKSSNKRAKLLPKLETVFSDGANCLPQTAASSSKSKNKRTKLSSNPVTESSSRDTRIDRDMETEALETTSVTPLSTTILKAEGKRPRHYRNPKGGASSQSKVPPSHAGGILNQFQKSVQNCQPPFKVSRDSPCRDEVPSNPCKSPQQNSDTEQQNCTKKRHTCPCCPKYFISRGDLKAHLKQEKHFKCKKCKECEKRFSYKKTLAKHVKDKHDPENESSYKCMVCDKEFGCERYMKEHEKVHEEHAYERYKCRKCEKGFPYRSILNKHMKSCR